MHSNTWNPFQVGHIWIRMLRIPFEWFKFGFEGFESVLPWTVRICIRMFRIQFEWFEFGFECFRMLFRMVRICIRISFEGFEFGSNDSNPFWMFRIWIRMLRIPLKWLEFALECFKSISITLNLHLNASNPFKMVRICIQMLQIHLKYEFRFEWFESLSNG